mgnify:CR=1 FL=1
MEKNMGVLDRIIRLIFSAIFILLFLTKSVPSTLGIVLLIISIIHIFTSFIGFCDFINYWVSGLVKNKYFLGANFHYNPTKWW